jgi:hypothetical protein
LSFPCLSGRPLPRRDSRVIGIVSRADLLRGLAQGEPKHAAPVAGATGHPIFDWLDKQFLHAQQNSPRTALTEERGSRILTR